MFVVVVVMFFFHLVALLLCVSCVNFFFRFQWKPQTHESIAVLVPRYGCDRIEYFAWNSFETENFFVTHRAQITSYFSVSSSVMKVIFRRKQKKEVKNEYIIKTVTRIDW